LVALPLPDESEPQIVHGADHHGVQLESPAERRDRVRHVLTDEAGVPVLILGAGVGDQVGSLDELEQARAG
jgi:hypothetical protein